MTTSTLLQYLLLRKAAIEDVLSTRGALLLGALFVLSAGFAREYDGEDLLHEPWHIALPFLASLAASFILYSLFALTAFLLGTQRFHFWRRYPQFLSLFWMTAPLAWLYAIPYEQFLTPLGATQANLLTLALVAVWRVLVISAAASILFGARFFHVCTVAMLYGTLVMLIALFLMPVPIFVLMGGLRPSPSEDLVRAVSQGLILVAVLLLPITALLAIGKTYGHRRRNEPWQPRPIDAPTVRSVSPGLWSLAIASLLVWIPVLPFTQPPQQARRHVERLFHEDRIEEAVAYLSLRPRTDFPPHWLPPPRQHYAFESLHFATAAALNNPEPNWVADHYANELLQANFFGLHNLLRNRWKPPISTFDWPHLAKMLADRPDGAQLAAILAEPMRPGIIPQHDWPKIAPLLQLADRPPFRPEDLKE